MSYSFFLGRPFPGTLRILSSVSGGYIVNFIRGFMPATWMRCLTAFSLIPSSAANSGMVIPFIVSIRTFSEKILKNYNKKLDFILTKSNTVLDYANS